VSELKDRLAQYINDLAVQRGEFTLTSGKKASFYIDLRQVSLDHRVAPLIGDVMLEVVSEFPDVELVGGLTMGADPIASAIMHRAVVAGRELDAFVVRKEPKGHGMGKQVEGPDVSGKRVIVVEDTSTTGGSPLKAIEAVEKAGGIVVAVAVVVDRDTGAKQVIEEAGYPYRAALGLADLGLA
jgi:orotate phosphoribosyltransferase